MHVLALLRDHSGTVMDLPYKFGATDRDVTREENFNMEIIREGVRPKKMSKDEYQAAVKEAKERQRQKEKEKRKEEKKRAEREASGRPATTDDEPVGPKLAPNGAPVLPTRPAPKARIEQPEEDHDKKKKKSKNNKHKVEGAAPTPGKAWQFWKK